MRLVIESSVLSTSQNILNIIIIIIINNNNNNNNINQTTTADRYRRTLICTKKR